MLSTTPFMRMPPEVTARMPHAAAPMAAVVQVVFEELYVTPRERRQDTSRAGALVTSETRENEE